MEMLTHSKFDVSFYFVVNIELKDDIKPKGNIKMNMWLNYHC
jgi:hypothetical protein